MDNYRIFVAGAKKLEKQRNLIKAWANDYNEENDSIHIIVRSYENFGDRQNEYNNFIKKKANLVLFILDGKIGEKTEEELTIAVESLNDSNHPDVCVFLHSFVEKNEDIEHIEHLMNEIVGHYYIEYKNDEDLIAKSEKYISRKIKKTDQEKGRENKLYYWAKIVLVIICMFMVVIGVFFSVGIGVSKFKYNKTPEKIFETNTIYMDETDAIIFSYEGIQCTYYVANDSLGNYIEPINRTISNELCESKTILEAVSYGTTMAVLSSNLKYFSSLAKGGKGQKIAALGGMAAVCVGTVLGYCQGYAYGESYNEIAFHKDLRKYVENKNSWKEKVLKVKSVKEFMNQ